MPISNRCTGRNFYNNLTQRTDVEVNVEYEQVKHNSNKDFFINNADNLVNLNSFKHEQPKWLDSFAAKNKINSNECYNNYWVHYLDKTAWVCSMEVTHLNKKYTYYSLSNQKKDSLNLLILKRQDSIKNIIKI